MPDSYQTKFQDLFNPHIKNHKCKLCQSLDKLEDTFYSFDQNQNFRIVRLNNVVFDKKLKKTKRIKTIINSFDTEKTVLPGSNFEFRLVAAVQHIPSSDLTGHYVCWVRRNDNWLMISDTNSNVKDNFIKDLENVYYMLFEKF